MGIETEIRLEGRLIARADDIATVMSLLPEHLRLSRAEPGCLRFDIWQDADDPAIFHVAERFTDRAAFDAHQARNRKSDWWRATRHLERDFRFVG